jgi:ElaB/YqjD/DUF883 family membrane-anchored ribosome-binding protein
MGPISQSSARVGRENGKHLADLAATTSDIAQQTEAQLEGLSESFKNLVTNRPVLALSAAVAAGVLLGWLIKRR